LKCRHCQSPLSLNFLDLGTAPPSNAYLSKAALNGPETWLPLRLLVCEQCWLVQVEDYAASDELFTADYAYFSSFSSSWLAHSERYTREMTARFGLGPQAMVCEVAANDGYLLQYFQRAGIPCYGVEPTASTAAAARAKGLEIVEEFFGVPLAERLLKEGRAADLTAANNVLAHVPDINGFVAGFAMLLKPHGVSTFEFPHLMQMAAHNQFDTAYHEHYSYLSLTAVQTIFAANGLTVFDVQEWPTHGGSLRVFAQRSDTGGHEISPAVALMLERERQAGMTAPAFYRAFQERAEKIKNDMVAFLIDARRQGKKTAGYGAAAKGNTLLNFGGVRPDLLPYVVDKNPSKQNQFMPGSRIPIVTEQRLKDERPDYIIILPWNLKEELAQQLVYTREWGAKFVTAVPSLSVF
jgi:SAM-dependent methyltransferase